VDAPCTATGVIRRHPDIKILRRESDVARLAQHQQEILDQMWPLLRPGGHLLYATCSILREENQSQAIAFLDRNADSEPVMLELARDLGLEAGPGRQILPGDAGMDGFYYACLRKLS
jgi:16S rRNA (cytosine967-C5)-methyltransferase